MVQIHLDPPIPYQFFGNQCPDRSGHLPTISLDICAGIVYNCLMMFVIRKRMTITEGSNLQKVAHEFFEKSPRRRVFRVSDNVGPWFNVRRGHIDADIALHVLKTLGD